MMQFLDIAHQIKYKISPFFFSVLLENFLLLATGKFKYICLTLSLSYILDSTILEL